MATNLDDPPTGTFEAFITSERERLSQARSEIYDQQKELEEKLDAIDRELAAIKAYEDTKRGKLPAAPQAEPKERRTRQPREGGRRGKREEVLQFIRDNYELGCTASELNMAMGAQDKQTKQGIANALSALKKEGKLRQDTPRGPYVPVQ